MLIPYLPATLAWCRAFAAAFHSLLNQSVAGVRLLPFLQGLFDGFTGCLYCLTDLLTFSLAAPVFGLTCPGKDGQTHPTFRYWFPRFRDHTAEVSRSLPSEFHRPSFYERFKSKIRRNLGPTSGAMLVALGFGESSPSAR